jgi:hypothetical protein
MNLGRIRAVLVGAAATALMIVPSAAWAVPPGNNGTVKIDGVEFDEHPNNQPHVGCVFQVDFYGYDAGNLNADYGFSLVPPTSDGSTGGSVFIGEDAAGGGTDLDAEVTVDLSSLIAQSGLSPHPQQGYHVKLTVHADGSQGADVKHKVFWVTGCGPVGSAENPPATEGQTLDSTGTSAVAPLPQDEGGSLTGTQLSLLMLGAVGLALGSRAATVRLIAKRFKP